MRRFRTCSLDQPLLLAPSLQDWLPEKHLGRFIAGVVAELDLSELLREYEPQRWPGSNRLPSGNDGADIDVRIRGGGSEFTKHREGDL